MPTLPTISLPTGAGVNTPASVSTVVNTALAAVAAYAIAESGGGSSISTVSVTTTTLSAGSQATGSGSVSGSTLNLTLGIPAGATGATGSGGGSLATGSIVQPVFMKTPGLTLTNPNASTSIPAFAPLQADPGSQIIVDAATVVGDWLGVGGALTQSAAYCLMTYLTPSARTAILTEVFGTYNFPFLRVPMGSCDYTPFAYQTYADNGGTADPTLASFSIAMDEEYLIPLIQEILVINPHINLLFEPWTPPVWLKGSGSLTTGSFTVNSTNLATWAQYFILHYQAYLAFGITAKYYGPQNEPNNSSTGYPCCGWAAADLVTFVGTYLGPAFDALGITDVEFITPSVSWGSSANYSGTQLATVAANSYISALGAHGYSGAPVSTYTTARYYAGAGNGNSKAKPIFLTEWEATTQSSAQTNLTNMAGTQAISCVKYGTSALIYWNLCLDQNGAPWQGNLTLANNNTGPIGLFSIDNSTGAIVRSAAYYVYVALSQFVKPGCKKIKSNCFVNGYNVGFTDVANVAFLNPDGSRFVYLYNANSIARTVTITDAVTRESTVVTLNAQDFGVVSWGPGTTVADGTYTAPSAPQTLTANAGTGIVNLTWLAPSTTGSSDLGGYMIERGTTAGGENTNLPIVALPPGTLSYSDTTGTVGTTYYYKVLAYGIGGYSPASNEANAASTGAATVTAAPTVVVTPGNAQNALVISVPSNGGGTIQSYTINRSTTSGSETLLTTVTSAATSISYTDSGLTNSTEYFYTATCTNSVGTSAASAEVNGTPIASATVTAAPTVTVTPGNGQNVINMSVPNNGGSTISSFGLNESLTSGAETTLTTISTSATSATYTHTGLTNGTEYYYKATCTNGIGTSTSSAEASGTPAVPVSPAHYLVATGTAGGMATPTGSGNINTTSAHDQRMFLNLSTISYGSEIVLGGNYPITGGSKTTSAFNMVLWSDGNLGAQFYLSDGSFFNFGADDAASGTVSGNQGAVTGTPALLSSVITTSEDAWVRTVLNFEATAWVDADGLSHPARSCQAFYSTTGAPGSWVQFGSTRAIAGALTTLMQTPTVHTQAFAGIVQGHLYKWQVQDANFNYLINADLTAQATGTTTFTDSATTPNTFTVTSPSSVA